MERRLQTNYVNDDACYYVVLDQKGEEGPTNPDWVPRLNGYGV
jgi:hypothetical protein